MSLPPRRLSGLSAISDLFDAAILDQWGVLHDGAKAPPGVIDAVAAMAKAGKRLVVLSNSARLGNDASGRLAALGYDLGWFAGFVTSGETVRDMLRDRTDPFFANLGKSVLAIAREPMPLDAFGYRMVATPEEADFILFGSSTAPEMSLGKDHAPILARAAARKLPAVCANPDRVGVAATGLIEGPGLLAAHYQSLGGIVRYIGKPHPEVYRRCMGILGGVMPDRIIAIGDSLEHDIAGGYNAGCCTGFVLSGIHVAETESEQGRAALYARMGVTPDYEFARLNWGV